jgi:hypothetical protein
VYPISHGCFINFVAFEMRPHKGMYFRGPWVADVDPSYIASLFQGWEKDVCKLIQVRQQPLGRETPALPMLTMASFQCLGGLMISRWAVNVLPPLPFFVLCSHIGAAVGLSNAPCCKVFV